jgi:hypothetical protein
MHALKSATRKALSVLGYQITRSDTLPAPRISENFLNLAQAYEQRLNEMLGKNLIAPNDLRPRLLSRLLGTPPSEAYFIVQALAETRDVEGDVCEFGVAQGETSALIANEIRASNSKTLHLFDSFEGLPTPSARDSLKDDIFSPGSMGAYAGTMSCPEAMVWARLRAISFPEERVVVHRGYFEKCVLEDARLPRRVSFSYVDFDLYEPTRLVLDFLHTVTAGRAIILIDDYDFFSTGVKAATDEFVELHNGSRRLYEKTVPDTRYGHMAILKRIT